MGRGRSKAKQTKVARDLKYNSTDLDLEQLADELHRTELNKTSPSELLNKSDKTTIKEVNTYQFLPKSE